MFLRSFIYATADIEPYNRTHGYDIKLIGTAVRNTNDTSTNDGVLTDLTLNADGNTGTNIYVEVTDTNSFSFSKIYARDANSVNIYCHQGADCNNIMIECPENNLNTSCKIYCDGDSNTNCRNIQLNSTNDYCKDVALLCMGNDCLIGEPKIYCGLFEI